MADLFRKTSLEKLSSPEQLDKMIVITPLSFWIALSGAAVMIVVALIWSIFGRLPINVDTQGIYINRGGTYTVYSEVAGIVEEVVVKNKEVVEKGDVIAYLNSDDIQKKIDEFQTRIEMVEAISIDSMNDVVNADNSNLIDIKNQMLTVDQSLQQSQAMLTLRSKNVTAQREVVASVEQKMREAEDAYYASLNSGDSTSEQLAYTEAQSALANAAGYLESAYSGLDQAQVAYTQAAEQYQTIEQKHNKLAAEEEALKANYETAKGAVVSLYSSLNPDSELTEEMLHLLTDPVTNGYGLEGNIDWKNAVDAYATAYTIYVNTVNNNAASKAELQAYMEQYKLERDSAETTKNNYQDDVTKYTEQKEQASKSYNEAKNNYLNRIQTLNGIQNDSTILSNTYSMALTTYNNEVATLNSLIDAMDQMSVQVDSERNVVEQQTKVISTQFAATKASIIDQLKRECESYEEQKKQCTIVATVSGTVSNVAVVQGSAVNQGSEVIKVAQSVKGKENDRIIVCYVPLNLGKKITEGMNVLIYPTTVNKQEYGHMEATVKTVDSYVTSTDTLRTQLGNDNLVESFLQNGPVVAVMCELQKDQNTTSGYYWSSKKGASVSIEEGTLVEASVVIEEKAPITMLIPYIKEKLTIQQKEQ